MVAIAGQYDRDAPMEPVLAQANASCTFDQCGEGEMSTKGLLTHDLDKRLVSAVIYLSRAQDELGKLDLRKVPNERREAVRELRVNVAAALATCKAVRKG